MNEAPKGDVTLAFYDREAARYAARPRFAPGRSRSAEDNVRRLDAFARRLPAGGRILELGCGSGEDALALERRGFLVRATDGSPEMAREAAKRLGRAVDVLPFEHLDERAVYDGVWANASLLHVPRAAFDDVLARIRRALKPGGAFYASFKAGAAEGVDGHGRYYNYPDEAWLTRALQSGAWSDVVMERVAGEDGETDWLQVLARAR